MYGRQMDEQLKKKRLKDRQTDEEAKNGQKGD